jgi:hypothetical protein
MVLEGSSVFGQDGLEPFSATVIAVMPDFIGPAEDLILVRLSGPAAERFGVVSGMSGSPAYYEGKLVGAVSYRFGSFPREPLAGITPAASMLAIVKDRRQTGRAKATPLSWTPASTDYGEAQPIKAPLVCGGCPEAVLAEFAPKLRAMGFEPLRGGASAGPNQEFRGGDNKLGELPGRPRGRGAGRWRCQSDGVGYHHLHGW